MFKAALFTIDKLWSQIRCPTIDEWIKKIWFIYTRVLLATKKNEVMLSAGKWMDWGLPY
jgi:hypothetical protein